MDLSIIVFASQNEGRELVGFGQGAVAPESAWAWTADASPPPGGRAERIGSHGVVREVVSFYRVGNVVTGSGVEVKLETLKTHLRARAAPHLAPRIAPVMPARRSTNSLARSWPIDRRRPRAAGLG